MPEIPDYQTLMLPVLRLASEREITVPGIIGEIAAEFQLTPDQLAQRIPSGRVQLFSNRIYWAKTKRDFPAESAEPAIAAAQQLLARRRPVS